jgi:hypothetical protein
LAISPPITPFCSVVLDGAECRSHLLRGRLEEGLKLGDTWVHLRLCRTCGHVGCCDDSKNRHATKHFHATQHPIMTSIEPGENWSWCYIDQLAMELPP